MNVNSYNCCSMRTKEHQSILVQLDLIKLLSDKNRLQILCVLKTKQHSVSELVAHLGVSQSLVSHHLISLKELRLVTSVKIGRSVIYSLSTNGTKVIQLLRVLSNRKAT